MANARIFRETQAADQLRDRMQQLRQGPGERQAQQANWQRTAGDLWQGVYSAMADINRRVFEEPWFGRPVNDVLQHVQSRVDRSANKDRPVDQNAEQTLAQGQDPAHASPDHSHDYDPKAFYGREEEQQGHDYDPAAFYGQEQSKGMER